MIDQPQVHLPRWLRLAAPLLAATVHRYIAAGAGCDCNLDAVRHAHGGHVVGNGQASSEPTARIHDDQQ